MRRGPPIHQNKTKWVPSRADKHNTLRATVEALPNEGVCRRCHDQIEWKKEYGKYKPLKQPAKCVRCSKKAVELAYHMICPACSISRHVCAKCEADLPPPGEDDDDDTKMPDASELAGMTERQRRNLVRKAERAQAKKKEEARQQRGEGDAATSEPSGFVLNHVLLSSEEAARAMRTGDQSTAEAARIAHAAKQHEEQMAAARTLREEHEAAAAAKVAEAEKKRAARAAADPAGGGAGEGAAAVPAAPSKKKSAAPPPTLASYLNKSDEAACDAVEAEMASGAEDDDDDDDDEEVGEDGDAAEGAEAQVEEDSDDDDDDDDDDDPDEESLREQVANLSHSPGAAVLVLQGSAWLDAAAHFATAEAGFDALVERLSAAGGASAAAADAMSDRVAAVFDKACGGTWPGGGTAEQSGAACLAMLLEIECYACVLPASFEADATAAEKRARKLLSSRGEERMAELS